ncbi:MAG: hypothetical protein V7682_10080 [Cycloclasticus sp.]
MADNKLNPMLEQDEAIDSYFNDLLFTLDESQAEKPQSPAVKLVHSKNSFDAEQINDEKERTENALKERVEAERIEAERIEAERIEAERIEAEWIEAEKVETERVETERVEAERVEAASVIDCPNAPVWAGRKFKVIVAVLNNVKLAFPVSFSAEKIAFTAELKAVKGQLDWVLGVKLIDKNFIAVVDAGNLLLKHTVRDVLTNPYKEILLLKDSRWGLAFDSLSEEIEINTAEVKWRDEPSVRPWLCGFESEQQLAIIDPAKMFIEDK